MSSVKTSLAFTATKLWQTGFVLAVIMSAIQPAPAEAQDENDAPVLRFQQFPETAAVPLQGQVQRPYPFGIYRTDTLNHTGPSYSGWSYLTPNQYWRGRTFNVPSRRRYGLAPDRGIGGLSSVEE